MGIYSLAVRTSNITIATATLEIIGSANIGYRLLELGMTSSAATAVTFGYGPNNAIGNTPTSPVTVLSEDRGSTTAGNSNTALAWGTGPTVPTNFFRRVSLPATAGAGIIWTFPRGITVLKAASSVVWNITAGVASDI